MQNETITDKEELQNVEDITERSCPKIFSKIHTAVTAGILAAGIALGGCAPRYVVKEPCNSDRIRIIAFKRHTANTIKQLNKLTESYKKLMASHIIDNIKASSISIKKCEEILEKNPKNIEALKQLSIEQKFLIKSLERINSTNFKIDKMKKEELVKKVKSLLARIKKHIP